MLRLRTKALAKVNLVLRVGPLRPDGFHEIASLIAPIDLADDVEVRVGVKRGPVRCRVLGRTDLDGPLNLASVAAESFRRRFGFERAVAIRIRKRIPVTAGLGGGSSDAAAVLRCLARAFPLKDERVLRELAGEVGSDVPFFLEDGPSWARGRGERLRPARVPRLHLLLLYPEEPLLAIRAKQAYGWLDSAREGRPPPKLPRVRPYAATLLGNDLQLPCLAARPALGSLVGRLGAAGATTVMMSGSGPTFFGIFPGRSSLVRATRVIESEALRGIRIIPTCTASKHPGVTSWRSLRSASSR